MSAEPVCDIVLLVWNHQEETAGCLEALRRTVRRPCRLLIVDNGSESPTREWLRTVHGSEWLAVEILRNDVNKGSPGGFNRGLRASRAPYVCLLSNDTRPMEGWLDELLAVAQGDPRIGLVGPSSNTAGQRIPEGMSPEAFAAQRRRTERGWFEMSYGEFFCLLVSRAVIDRVGTIDESYGMAYFDDTDFCRRAVEAGFLCVQANAAFVYHAEGRSLKDTWRRAAQRREQFDRAAARFAARWGVPKRLAYVVFRQATLEAPEVAEALRRHLRSFHRVWLFHPDGRRHDRVPQHADLLRWSAASWRFVPGVLWKIVIKKKRFHDVYTDHRGFRRLLQVLRPFHRARVEGLS